MRPMTANPVYHIPISSPHFSSCYPVFEMGLELNIHPSLWPDCFALKHWCCVGFDSIYEVDVTSLTEVRPLRAVSGGLALSLQKSSADRLWSRVTERQRLQEKRARAARAHLESYGFMETLVEEGVQGEDGDGNGKGLGVEVEGEEKCEGPSPGPGLGPSRLGQRPSASERVDADARSVMSSRASMSLSSDAETLVDKDKDRASSKWSLGSMLTGSRRSSIISTGEDRDNGLSKEIELLDWNHG